MGKLSDCPVRYVKPSQLQSRRLYGDEVIIEVSGGGKEQTTGRTGYITNFLVNRSEEPMICASFCKLMRINSQVIRPTLVYLYLQHIYDERLIGKYEVQSTGIKNFKFEYFLDEEKILIPPTDLQDRFHATVSKILELIHILGAIQEEITSLVQVMPREHEELFGLADLQILNSNIRHK